MARTICQFNHLNCVTMKGECGGTHMLPYRERFSQVQIELHIAFAVVFGDLEDTLSINVLVDPVYSDSPH